MGGPDLGHFAAAIPPGGGVTVLQTVDPAVLVEAGSTVRGSLAFLLVLVVGGALRWRFEPFLERSIDSSSAKPLLSLVYGVAAHAVFVFAGIYLASQLAQVQVSGWNAGSIGILFGVLLMGGAASLGFTVVGATIVKHAWAPVRGAGVVVGALVAGGVAVIDPLFALALWLVLVSIGIGGPIRTWLHASAVSE